MKREDEYVGINISWTEETAKDDLHTMETALRDVDVNVAYVKSLELPSGLELEVLTVLYARRANIKMKMYDLIGKM